VARESADVVLLGNDLLEFVETVQVARRCRHIIGFNFAGTLAVDSIGMGLAAVGMLNPLFAAFIHLGTGLHLRGAAQRNASRAHRTRAVKGRQDACLRSWRRSAAPEKAFPAIAPWGKTARARSLFEGAGTSSR
jgi:hypothetical protein